MTSMTLMGLACLVLAIKFSVWTYLLRSPTSDLHWKTAGFATGMYFGAGLFLL